MSATYSEEPKCAACGLPDDPTPPPRMSHMTFAHWQRTGHDFVPMDRVVASGFPPANVCKLCNLPVVARPVVGESCDSWCDRRRQNAEMAAAREDRLAKTRRRDLANAESLKRQRGKTAARLERLRTKP